MFELYLNRIINFATRSSKLSLNRKPLKIEFILINSNLYDELRTIVSLHCTYTEFR